jgi:exodeoxyribonuclease III
MRIASWNVNSVNARLDNVLSWLAKSAPDVVVLQEIKCVEEKFPLAAIEGAGYQAAIVGEKSYNGVALLSRLPFELRQRALPGDEADSQSRYVEAAIGEVIVAGIYLPNGNPIDNDEKYGRKLRWMDRLLAHARDLLAEERRGL